MAKKYYRIYIDETGTDDITPFILDQPDSLDLRYLGVTGVIIPHEEVKYRLNQKIEKIKTTHLKYDADDTVILHRPNIIKAKKQFHALADPEVRQAFDKELIDILKTTDFKTITVVIDKFCIQKQHHWNEKNPYHFAAQILIEKYAEWLQRNNGYGDMYAEKRQGQKDINLETAISQTIGCGTKYVSKQIFQERFTSTKLKFAHKHENLSGLQIADIVSHPLWQAILAKHKITKISAFNKTIITALHKNDKIDKSPYTNAYWGYGLKFIR